MAATMAPVVDIMEVDLDIMATGMGMAKAMDMAMEKDTDMADDMVMDKDMVMVMAKDMAMVGKAMVMDTRDMDTKATSRI